MFASHVARSHASQTIDGLRALAGAVELIAINSGTRSMCHYLACRQHTASHRVIVSMKTVDDPLNPHESEDHPTNARVEGELARTYPTREDGAS